MTNTDATQQPNPRAPGRESSGVSAGAPWAIYVNRKKARHELAVNVAPSVRRKVLLPVHLTTPAERAAFARGAARELVAVYREQRKNPPAPDGSTLASPVTFSAVGVMWTSGELHRRHPDHVHEKKTVGCDEQLLKVLNKTIGDVPIATFTLEDAERAMSALDASLAPATRRQYAQAIHRVLQLAVYPLRLRASNPLPRGFLPSPGADKAKSYVYPDEDAKLMACTNVRLALRVLYGTLAREGLRLGEATALVWSDLDLQRGVLRLDENKTADPRAWAMSPGVVRALVCWRKVAATSEPHERVFTEANGSSLEGTNKRFAELFRRHLKLAGVDRPELFQRSKVRMPIRVHDLRATFVTISLATGKSEAWVTDRTGHKSSTMVHNYKRAARQASELGLGELAPLDEAIPEFRPVSPPVSSPAGGQSGDPVASVTESNQAVTEHPTILGKPKSAASAYFATRAVKLLPIRCPMGPLL